MARHPLARGPCTGLDRPARPRDRRLPLIYRLASEVKEVAGAEGELARDSRLALVEAALMAADEPLPARRLVARLRELYDRDGTAFQVEELAGGYQLLTRPEYHPWLARLRRGATELRLGPAARETLAVVAYRQPVTRADVEAVRGVQASEVLRQLMEKGLVRIAGRDDSLGRPVLYGTTKKFLQVYGLRTLRDLPPVEEQRGPASKEDAAAEEK